MKKVAVYNSTKGILLLPEAEVADSFWRRLIGLMGRKQLSDGSGLIIKPCNSIHMIGMRFPIDVIFVDEGDQICHIIQGMRPMQISPIIWNAKYVIEAPSGTVFKYGVEFRDQIEWMTDI